MLTSDPIPEVIFVDAGDGNNWGYRVKPENPDYDTTPEEANIEPASILSVYTHVGNWIYRNIKEYREDKPLECKRSYNRGDERITFKVKNYFPYSVKYLRLKYAKSNKKRECPTCFCKTISDQITEEIILPKLIKRENNVIKTNEFDIEIHCFEEAFSLLFIFRNLKKL